MKAEELLAIKNPSKLFPTSIRGARQKFTELARQWHPDHSKDPRANEVFIHIRGLYKAALKSDRASVLLHDSRQFDFEIWCQRKFELGEYFIGPQKVVYLIDKVHAPLVAQAYTAIKNFRFASDPMRTEFEKTLPVNSEFHVSFDGRSIVAIPRAGDLIPLEDVREHFNGRVPAEHVAWIMSCLHHTVCYLAYSEMAHHDISPSTYFISPSTHSGKLVGGWWYALKKKRPLKTVPRRTFDLLPWEIRKEKRASSKTDLMLIRDIGLQLLGGGPCPRQMLDYLRTPGSGNPFSDYERWPKVLVESFGKRRYVKMELTPETVFKP